MFNGLHREIAVGVLGSLAWTLIVVAAGALWYFARSGARGHMDPGPRPDAAGLLPQRRRPVQAVAVRPCPWPGAGCQDAGQVLLRLVKLEADLQAFDRLTGMWAQRVASLPLWYPYATEMRAMLEAQTALHVALSRHVTPFRSVVERMLADSPEDRSGGVMHALDSDFSGYARYFLGGRDRVWGTPAEAFLGEASARVFEDLRNLKLADRLQAVFTAMQALFQRAGTAGTLRGRIWAIGEEPDRVWFTGSASGSQAR